MTTLLRPVRLTDTQRLFDLANDEGVWSLAYRPLPESLGGMREYLTRVCDLPWVFTIEHNGHIAGMASLLRGERQHKLTAELGGWLGRVYQRHGIGLAGVKWMLAFAMINGIRRVESIPGEDNVPAQKVLEAAGMVLEGRQRARVTRDDRQIDELVYVWFPEGDE